MTPIHLGSLDGRAMRLLRMALIVWALVWLGLAAATAYELYVLRDLARTVSKTGVAIDTTGKALQSLGGLPFVGGEMRLLAGQTRAAGESAVVSGRSSESSATDLAILIGVAIALIPTAPAVAIYLPVYTARRRERLAVRRALDELDAGDEALEEYLARRAVANLSYAELRSVTARPWADLEAGRFERLASAELSRLGLSRTPEDGTRRTAVR